MMRAGKRDELVQGFITRTKCVGRVKNNMCLVDHDLVEKLAVAEAFDKGPKLIALANLGHGENKRGRAGWYRLARPLDSADAKPMSS